MSSEIARLEDVSFRRGTRLILDRVRWVIRPGERWAVIGPNGSGKSTLLSLVGAVAHPTSGSAQVLGERLGRTHLESLRRRIGHVNPAHPLRAPLSALGVVLTGFTGTIDTPLKWQPSADQLRRARQALAEVGLADREGAQWPVLSQGERGRLLIARALVSAPPLLLLDEPATGLDVAARERFFATVDLLCSHSAVTTVLVTHHLEELPASTTHALLLSRGRVVTAGEAGQVLTSPNLSAAFEYPLAVTRDATGRWSAKGA